MTIPALIKRFAITYLLSLLFAFLLVVYFRNSSTLIIMTAALAASTLYVCQLFCRKNGRAFIRREMLQAWAAFLAIDIVLQGVTTLSFVGTAQENIARLEQFAAGGLVFTAFLHGICIFLFIFLAGKVASKKMLAAPAGSSGEKDQNP
ncbi:MAG: ABZJ_00895 family protein [Propionivibrio sp.]